MSATETKAASISPPQEGFARAGATGGEVFMLPTKWHGSYVTIQAEGQDVYVFLVVSRTAPTVPDQSLRSTITSNAVDLLTNFTAHIPAGQERHFNLDELAPLIRSKEDRVWFGHDAAVAGGVVRGWKSSGPKG